MTRAWPATLLGALLLCASPAYADGGQRFYCEALFREDVRAEAAATFIAKARLNPTDISFAQQLSPREFTSLENFNYRGAPGTFMTATYRGVKVFLKSKPSMNAEAAWYRFLKMLGLGAEFYGVTVINERPYLVLEYVEGDPSKFVELTAAESRLTRSKVDEMKRQLQILENYGVSAEDVQFVFRKDGSVAIIDPELWSYTSPSNVTSLLAIRELHAFLITEIKLNWYKAGKLADQ